MGDKQKRILLSAAMIGLCEGVILHSAIAAPPLEKVTAALGHVSKGNSTAMKPPGRLDLRVPSDQTAGNEAVAEPVSAPASHAPASHWLFASEPPRADARAFSPPAAESGHIMSPMQTMMHNYRQEGLPVAKLFQSNQSLVHLGLNPKGKPGLWIIHKLH